MHAHTTPLFPVIIIGPFTKWGIDFTTCNLPSTKGHKYIIVAVDYFTKWVEAMPTVVSDGETKTLFLFNQVISHFGIPKGIVTDHGSHFQNKMMAKLALNLGFWQENSSPYYLQANGQMSVKTATTFSPFQLVYGLESIFPMECEIPSLKLVVELIPDTYSLEEHLIHLEHFDEQCRDATTINEAHKKRVKVQYDKVVCPRVFSEGDLVLVYDQDKDTLGEGKFEPMWYDPFIVKKI
eukprot:PITA_21675